MAHSAHGPCTHSLAVSFSVVLDSLRSLLTRYFSPFVHGIVHTETQDRLSYIYFIHHPFLSGPSGGGCERECGLSGGSRMACEGAGAARCRAASPPEPERAGPTRPTSLKNRNRMGLHFARSNTTLEAHSACPPPPPPTTIPSSAVSRHRLSLLGDLLTLPTGWAGSPLTVVTAGLIAFGGLMGFVRKGSVVSLIAGGKCLPICMLDQEGGGLLELLAPHTCTKPS